MAAALIELSNTLLQTADDLPMPAAGSAKSKSLMSKLGDFKAMLPKKSLKLAKN